MSENEALNIQRRLWVPVIGYYINFRRSTKTLGSRIWVTINSSILVMSFLLALTVPFSPAIPMTIAAFYVVLFGGILLFFLFAAAIIETFIVRRVENANRSFFRAVGWTRLAGHSLRYVFINFVFFNYHEVMFGIIGVAYIFLVHALV